MIAYLLPDNTIRFEADTYVPAEGEVALPALPAWNVATHRIEWDGAAWQIIALTGAQLAAKAAEQTIIATAPFRTKRQRIIDAIHDALANESDPDPVSAGIVTNFPLALRSWVNGLIDQATTAIQARALDSRVDNVVTAAQAHVAEGNTAHGGFPTQAAFNTLQTNAQNHAAQTTAAHGGIVASTDPRLTDARTPTAHGHAISEITALQTVLNALGSSYRTLIEASGSHTAAKVAGTYALANGEALAISGTGTLYPIALVQIAAADWPTIGGVAAKLRIRAQLATNDVAPTGTYTFGLHPVTRPATSGGAGLCIYTLGAAVTGSTGATFSAPAADAMLTAVSADFALPADGMYALGMVQTGTVATSAHLHIAAQLQLHNA